MLKNSTMIVTINLSFKYAEDFLRHIFQVPSGTIEVSRTCEIGKFLFSLVECSNRPTHQTGLTLSIPRTKCDSLRNKFLTISKSNQERFNDYIESQFYINFEKWMVECTRHGLSYSRAIILFIDSMNITEDNQIYETLKKRDYRNRKKMKKNLFSVLQCIVF